MRFFAFSMYFSFILQIFKNGKKNVESNCVKNISLQISINVINKIRTNKIYKNYTFMMVKITVTAVDI